MGFSKENAAGETGSSAEQVRRAWHDAAGSGHLGERNTNKVSDSANGPKLLSIFQKAGMVGSGNKEGGKKK